MMGRIGLIFGMLLACQVVLAQRPVDDQNRVNEAKEYFSIGDYLSAWNLLMPLSRIVSNDAEVNFLMGTSAWHLTKYRSSAKAYLKLSAEANYIDAFVPYAKALLFAEQPEEALSYLNKATPQTPEQERNVKQIKSHCMNAIWALKNPVPVVVEVLNENVNSDFVDHTPLISNNDSILYFTSRRPLNSKSITDLSGEYDENIYVSFRQKNGWSKASPIAGNVNEQLNESTVSLQMDGKKMLIFKTSRDLETSNLWSISKQDSSWRLDKKLPEPINSKSGENSATINSNGNVYYFSSDRPGGFGGFDLYRVVVFGNGQLSVPINLGAPINTEFDETAPFLLPDNHTLYFSSDRLESIGGFDMFQSKLINDSIWQTPLNLGYPLNSTGDNAHMSISWLGGIAYFTRENPDHAGDFDICYANLPGFNIRANIYRFRIANFIKGTPVAITLLSQDLNKSIGVFNVNSEGEFTLVLLPEESGVLEIKALGFELYQKEVKFQETKRIDEFKQEINLKPIVK